MLRVLLLLPRVELGRIAEGPSPLLRRLRALSGDRPLRTPKQREQLRRAIFQIDARLPGGGNCYRRSLLEVALDRGAAEEPFFMGLSSVGGPESGHAWIGSNPDIDRRYDVVIAL